MKKLILAMVFVFATGTMMNANSSNEEIITSTTESIEVVEEYFGCARDCVDSSIDKTFDDAIENSSLPQVSTYMENYRACYAANC